MPKAIGDADGGVGGFVMDGIPATCSEHVRGQATTRQRKGIATAVRQQVQWDSQDTCSHHGASHAAGGKASRSGIIRPAEQGVPAGGEWLESARQWWSQLVQARQGDERHCDCARRAPAGAGSRLGAGARQAIGDDIFGSKPSSASRTAPETKCRGSFRGRGE